jgi:ParB-like chromosome segregation protein Spo0J
MWTRHVFVDDCIPMPKLERQFYNERDYDRLKKVIARDGFKKQYAVRAIYDKKLRKYLVFDGIHRTLVAKELGIKKIPLIDETGTLSKAEVIAEGIKANCTHGYYNALDIAKNLYELSSSLSDSIEKRSVGRPETVNLTKLSDLTGYSEQTVSRYFQLLKLPEEVQTIVGKGKLGLTNALVMMKLLGTPYENMISTLAQEAVSKGISRQDLQKRVAMTLKKGYYNDEKRMCVGCQKVYSIDRLSYSCLCAECVGKVRSEHFRTPNPERMVVMQRFLKLRNWVEKRHQNGDELPQWVLDRVEVLQEECRGETSGYHTSS